MILKSNILVNDIRKSQFKTQTVFKYAYYTTLQPN